MMRTQSKLMVLDALTRMTDARKKFVESSVKRGKKGSPEGGKFASKSGGSKGGKAGGGFQEEKTGGEYSARLKAAGKRVTPVSTAYSKITGKPLSKLVKARSSKTSLEPSDELEYHSRLTNEISRRLTETTLAQARNIAGHADLRKMLKAWGGDAGKRGDGASGNELAARAVKLLQQKPARKKSTKKR